MIYRPDIKHIRNFKFSKMSDNELKERYLYLRNDDKDYFNKKELNQLINYLMKHNKEDILC